MKIKAAVKIAPTRAAGEKIMSMTLDAPIAEARRQAGNKPVYFQEYLDSLRDGREIWIYGERVKDVTTHPAFRNTVRMLARLYDALHDQRKRHSLLRDRYRQWRLHAEVLQSPAQRGRDGRRARCHRRMGARDLRMDGPQPGLQSRVPRHARRQSRISIRRSTRTPAAGTRKCRRKSPSSTTPS